MYVGELCWFFVVFLVETTVLFSQVKQAVLGAHGVSGQVAGISFLESLVW